MACSIYLTTTGTLSPVPFADLGRLPGFAHPTTSYDLLQEFTVAQLQASVSLQAAVTAGQVTLVDCYGNAITDLDAQLEAVTSESHEAIRQLIHFIDSGPSTGVSVRKAVTGTAFPTAITWYHTVTAGEKKLVEKLITWTLTTPTTIVWNIYDDTGAVKATVTDTISYSGPFETGRTRVIS
jgi:hypothetical protein